jgi:hypothetical protein
MVHGVPLASNLQYRAIHTMAQPNSADRSAMQQQDSSAASRFLLWFLLRLAERFFARALTWPLSFDGDPQEIGRCRGVKREAVGSAH